ncbi:3-hydroxybenzoate 4-monooxygenase [Pigmentiphaga sp. H8]|uniref:FAD-binding monooxygenase n=1 Tax=Pigmentiphaga sp. H8 TaxID=2488560 RepID=UPI000F591243|nr:FAD-binding monooxygenase [Pigmentiphaga sp. H8]AZG07744.1 3-hydroxybenzoate 4-monooxygenase [Pigmentiphaga sp. H8]
MQFHLNGFKPGDPDISEPAGQGAAPLADALPGEVDILIVGSGPTGLTLATQLAAFPDLRTCIVEQKPGPLRLGQADGIACRTVEMFEAFDFSQRVLKEAYWVNETSFWKPDDAQRDQIVRSGRIQDTEDGLSEFPHVILNQARVHDFYLDVMRNAPSRLEPHYSRRLLDLAVAESPAGGAPTHPVTARFERTDPGHEGQVETVRARFAVGCDGAHSAVRKSLGRALHGESANQAWGVMDVLAVTDFPDIRIKSAIHSASEGSVLIIPREGGYLVRLYIELDKLNENERVASRQITSDRLIAAAQRILRPYTLDVKEVAWWSVYEIGQRLCDKFDDVPEQEEHARLPRVFIAGDACHTHSPKAGQGMNVSMQDGFNLGWKLAAVLRGQSTPQILHTYSKERQTVAKELIDFDREFAKMFSAAPKDPSRDDSEGIDPAEFQRYFVKQGRFTAGTETRYYPSVISAEPTHQELARGLVIGMRFHSAPVIRLADAKPMHLGHAVKADGRWRVFAFADAADPAAPSAAIGELCRFLAESSQSPIRKYTPAGADVDAVIDVRAVFQQGHRALALEAMPAFLQPRKGRYGLIDYEKMFCPDLKGGQDIFDLRGIDRRRGCVVIVRPDQYVAHVLPLDAHAELAGFFDGFMVEAG